MTAFINSIGLPPVFIALLVIVLLYTVMTLWFHYFPSKPGLHTEADVKKFLKLNEDQYYQIMKEAKQAVAQEVIKLLDERDKAINGKAKAFEKVLNENLSAADVALRKVVVNYKDEIHNSIAKLESGHSKAWSFLATHLMKNGTIEAPDIKDAGITEDQFLVQLYFHLHPEAKQYLVVKNETSTKIPL